MAENTESRISLVVHKTLQGASRRKQNVIILGLPEESEVDDSALFNKFCEYNMLIKPTVSDIDCLKIGKAEAGKPRCLLVRLTSEDSASSPFSSPNSQGNIQQAYSRQHLHQQRLFHLTLISLSFTVISFTPMFMLFDL